MLFPFCHSKKENSEENFLNKTISLQSKYQDMKISLLYILI